MRRRIYRRVAFVATLALLLPARAAFAQYPGGGEPAPTVGGEKFFRGGTGTARTGWDALLFLLIALILVALGVVAYLASKRGAQREA